MSEDVQVGDGGSDLVGLFVCFYVYFAVPELIVGVHPLSITIYYE